MDLLVELLRKVQLAPAGLGLVTGSVLGSAAGVSGGSSVAHARGTATGAPTHVIAHSGA